MQSQAMWTQHLAKKTVARVKLCGRKCGEDVCGTSVSLVIVAASHSCLGPFISQVLLETGLHSKYVKTNRVCETLFKVI